MTAPTEVPAGVISGTPKGSDATNWMDDPANWQTDSKAAQQVFELPQGTPGKDGKPPTQGLPGREGEPGPELGGEAKRGEETAREALERELGQAPTFTQDEKGRWHRPDGSYASATEVDRAEAIKAEEERGVSPPAPAAEVEAEAAKKAEAKQKARQPIGEVAIYDAEGNEVEFPEVMVTYKANDRTLEKVPLDKVIRMAQFGAYNEQRERESVSSRQEAEAARARIADLESANSQYEQYMSRLMQDEGFRVAAITQFQQLNTPEARLAAKDQEIQQIRQDQQQKEAQATAQGYVQREVAPRINALLAQLPQDDEVLITAFQGKTAYLTDHLKVNGQIPPQRLPEVVRLIDTVLGPWVESVTQGRKTADSKALESAKREVEAAKIALTLEKKKQQRAMMPQGRAGPLREAPKPLPEPKSAEEANQRLFDHLDAAYGGRR